MAQVKKTSFSDDVEAAVHVGPQPQTNVTAETYLAKAKAYVKTTPLKAWVVIRAREGASGSIASGKAPDDAEWIAWLAYRADLGISNRYVIREGVMTVPAAWPDEFDAGALACDRMAVLPSPRVQPYVSPERMASLFAKLGASLGGGGRRRPGEFDGRPDARYARAAEAAAVIRNAETDRLKALREQYAADPPPPLLDESREALGLPPLDDEIPM